MKKNDYQSNKTITSNEQINHRFVEMQVHEDGLPHYSAWEVNSQ